MGKRIVSVRREEYAVIHQLDISVSCISKEDLSGIYYSVKKQNVLNSHSPVPL